MGWITRFLAAVAFLAIGVIFSPETFGSKSDGLNSPKFSTYLKLAHLLSFSASWGSALWVTFIGGIIMFKYDIFPFNYPFILCLVVEKVRGTSSCLKLVE